MEVVCVFVDTEVSSRSRSPAVTFYDAELAKSIPKE